MKMFTLSVPADKLHFVQSLIQQIIHVIISQYKVTPMTVTPTWVSENIPTNDFKLVGMFSTAVLVAVPGHAW